MNFFLSVKFLMRNKRRIILIFSFNEENVKSFKQIIKYYKQIQNLKINLYNINFSILFFSPVPIYRLIILSSWSKCLNSRRMESFQFMRVAVILHLKISGKGKFDLWSLENSWIVAHLLPASLFSCLIRGRFKSSTQIEAFF